MADPTIKTRVQAARYDDACQANDRGISILDDKLSSDVNLPETFSNVSAPLGKLLTKFGELIEAGRLPEVSFSEWEKAIASSEEEYEKAKRIAREEPISQR